MFCSVIRFFFFLYGLTFETLRLIHDLRGMFFVIRDRLLELKNNDIRKHVGKVVFSEFF